METASQSDISETSRLLCDYTSATSTFESHRTFLYSLNPQSDFEIGVLTYLGILTDELEEMKCSLSSIRNFHGNVNKTFESREELHDDGSKICESQEDLHENVTEIFESQEDIYKNVR